MSLEFGRCTVRGKLRAIQVTKSNVDELARYLAVDNDYPADVIDGELVVWFPANYGHSTRMREGEWIVFLPYDLICPFSDAQFRHEFELLEVD